MKNKWRLVKTIETNGMMQMAIDEVLMLSNRRNTLRFYKWEPACISIGLFQDLKEIDFQKAKESGINVVRRYTGGGAAFHDKELTYSVVISEKDVPSDIAESYKFICSALVKGLEKLGIKSEFGQLNNILIDGKKISGNAQTRRNGVVLQHGTINLADNDCKFIKNSDKETASLNGKFTFDEVRNAVIEGFKDVFDANFDEEDLTKKEKILSAEFFKEKYSTEEWTNGDEC